MNAAEATIEDDPKGPETLGHFWLALFESLRSGVGDPPALAQHLLNAWRDGRERSLTLTADELICTKDDRSSSTELPWILPAFLAGVRKISILDNTSVDDIGTFAVALSRLKPSAQSITDFHDWLWTQSATGFEIELHASVIEKAESRWTAVVPLLSPIQAPPKDVDVTTFDDIAEAFSKKLEDYLKNAPPLLEVAEVEASQKKAQLQSDVGWVSSKLFCLLNLVHLQNQMEPHVVAKRLMEWLAVGTNAQSLNTLLDLEGQENLGKEIFAHLDSEDLGRRLGRSITLDGEPVRAAVGRLFETDVPRRNTFLQALVSRCTDDANAARFLRDVAYHLDPNALFQAVCGAHLNRDEVAVLIDFAMTNTTAGPLDTHLEEVAPEAIIDSFEGIEAHLLPSFSKTLTRLLLSEGDIAERTANLLRTLPAPAQVALANDVFSDGQTLSSATLAKTLSQILQEVPTGRSVLVDIVRDQQRSPTLRSAALTSLNDHPNERAQAARFRLKEFREPSELRAQLKAARKKNTGDERS